MMPAKISNYLVFLTSVLSTFSTQAAAHPGKPTPPSQCYYLPTDTQWPSDAQWNTLNKTVGGRLIRGVSLAQPCYGPNSDPTRCELVTKEWSLQDI